MCIFPSEIATFDNISLARSTGNLSGMYDCGRHIIVDQTSSESGSGGMDERH